MRLSKRDTLFSPIDLKTNAPSLVQVLPETSLLLSWLLAAEAQSSIVVDLAEELSFFQLFLVDEKGDSLTKQGVHTV